MKKTGKSVGKVTALTPPESAIGYDSCVEPDIFRKGFDDASARLAALPASWALHYATTTLADGTIPDIADSYERGYRAALYGYRRRARR